MKLWIFSDLHLEKNHIDEPLIPPTGADLAVVAGDVNMGIAPIEFLARLPIPVVYVPGNREYYENDFTSVVPALRAAAVGTNIHVLEKSSVVLGGVEFLGATLWTDFDLFGRSSRYNTMREVGAFAAPFEKIRYLSGTLAVTPEILRNDHLAARHWLERKLGEKNGLKRVVVSHHLPLAESLDPRFGGGVGDAMFASNLDHLFGYDDLPLWIHGHTHAFVDYRYNNTRVVCNPRGCSAREGVVEGALSFTVDV
jgi:predicted phosphodiesterase